MRHHTTYRGHRRNTWHTLNAVGWHWANRPDHTDEYREGSIAHGHLPANGYRSKYMPHIGAKERGRYAKAG